MSVLERLASVLDQRDEVPNQILAQEIASERDEDGVAELVANLPNPDKRIRYDCIKVLYEIGSLTPGLIEPYIDEFVQLLTSRDNRMVWGGMTALGALATTRADAMVRYIDAIIDATEHGSVITQDWGVRVLADIAAADSSSADRVAERVVSFLQIFLKECPPKDLPRHAESVLPAVSESNRAAFESIITTRRDALTPAQAKRLDLVLRQMRT